MSDSRYNDSGTYGLLLVAAALLLLVSDNDDADPTPFPWQGLLVFAGITVVGFIVWCVVVVIRDRIEYKRYLIADAGWQAEHGDASSVEVERSEDGSVTAYALRPRDPTRRVYY